MSTISSLIEVSVGDRRDVTEFDGDKLLLKDGTVIRFTSSSIAEKLSALLTPSTNDVIERAIWLVTEHPEVTPAILKAAHKIDPNSLNDPTALVYEGASDIAAGKSKDWSHLSGIASQLLVQALKALL
jgi:hypothetical protein